MAYDCDVLIVGGGPTGVTLALLLAQRGVRTIVAEREAGIYPLPRAAHIDHEIMRIFQEVGVADAVLASSRRTTRYDFLSAAGEVLLRFEGADRTGPGGWPASNMIHQPSIEAALRARLADPAELRSGWALTGFTDGDDGIEARFATFEGERTLRARYLVGADGARSPVRKTAGIEVDDLGFEEPWLVIDTLVHDAARLPPVNLQICDPERPTTCVLMGEGRHRWEFMIKPGEDPDEVANDASIAALMAPWQVDGAVSIERKAVYTFRARVAERWRAGRVLLAGDAAHQMPPFAGQGLCSGVRDAANLAWKLSAIVRDGAPDALLDTYQPEREPNLRAIIGLAMMMGRTVCITDRAAAAERDRQMVAARTAGHGAGGPPAYPAINAGLILEGSAGAGSYFAQPSDGETRLDDILGSGIWLIDRSLAADLPEAIRAALGTWLDGHGAEAVLVRPDRHVFGTGTATELRARWESALAMRARLPA
jgi:3-(3-hydroxy-phenyl)propionate hydroxylase